MSHLKIYCPSETNIDSQYAHNSRINSPHILPFPTAVPKPSEVLDSVTRARLIYENRTCPHCDHPAVQPIVTETVSTNNNLMPIPGDGVLIGFHCLECHYEWDI